MSGDESGAVVTCGRCGQVLDDPPGLPGEERRPCPVCGSLSRHVGITLATTAVASASVSVAVIGQALETDQALPVTALGGAAADEIKAAEAMPEAETIRDTYEATITWLKLDTAWLVQIKNVNGEVVEGAVTDDPEEALLEIYERLVPPTA